MFGADPQVIGTSVRLNDTPHTLIGVLPPGFDWGETELLRPRAPDPSRSRGDHQLSVIGLLKPHVTLDEARAELTAIAARLAQQYPKDNEGWSVRLVTFYDWLAPAAGAGVASRAAGRRAARAAHRVHQRRQPVAGKRRGSSQRAGDSRRRWRVTDADRVARVDGVCVLALVGAAAGVGLAAITIRVLSVYAANIVPRVDEVSIDRVVLSFAIVSALVSAAAFGLLPSLHAAREQGQALHDASRGSTGGRGRQRIRATLTVVEVALSVTLLIGARAAAPQFPHAFNASTQASMWTP